MKLLALCMIAILMLTGCSKSDESQESECPEHLGEKIEDMCEGDYYDDHGKKKHKKVKHVTTTTKKNKK